jgi:hypothetical protein
VEWYLVLHAQPYGPRRKKKCLIFLQFLLLEDGDGTQGYAILVQEEMQQEVGLRS